MLPRFAWTNCTNSNKKKVIEASLLKNEFAEICAGEYSKTRVTFLLVMGSLADYLKRTKRQNMSMWLHENKGHGKSWLSRRESMRTVLHFYTQKSLLPQYLCSSRGDSGDSMGNRVQDQLCLGSKCNKSVGHIPHPREIQFHHTFH